MHSERRKWGQCFLGTPDKFQIPALAAANKQLEAIKYCRGDHISQTRAGSAAFVIRQVLLVLAGRSGDPLERTADADWRAERHFQPRQRSNQDL